MARLPRAPLSPHASSYVPAADRGYFDGLRHTFVHERRADARTHNAVFSPTIPGGFITPLRAGLWEGETEARIRASCVEDLRELSVGRYSEHFRALNQGELAAARARASEADLTGIRLQLQRRTENALPLLAQVHPPHLTEGTPHLEVGCVVRLRPEGGEEGGRTSAVWQLPLGLVEVEAVVEAVASTRGIVLLRLPPRPVTRACMVCLDVCRAYARTGVDPGLVDVRLAAVLIRPCGHQVLCFEHLQASLLSVLTTQGRDEGLVVCPLCQQKGYGSIVGACPDMPVHLAGPAALTAAGTHAPPHSAHVESSAHVAASLMGCVQKRVSYVDTWSAFLDSVHWRMRFEETGQSSLLTADKRLAGCFRYSVLGVDVDRGRYLERLYTGATELGPIRKLAHALLDTSVAAPPPSTSTVESLAVEVAAQLSSSTLHGTDPVFLSKRFHTDAHAKRLGLGTPAATVYVRCMQSMALAYAWFAEEQVLFPTLPGAFSFSPDLLHISATHQARSVHDLTAVACVLLHRHRPSALPRLTPAALIRVLRWDIYKPTAARDRSVRRDVARNSRLRTMLGVVEALCGRQKVAFDLKCYRECVAYLAVCCPEEGPVLTPTTPDLTSPTVMTAWQALAQPVVHFLDDRLNGQQLAAVQAVVSGCHGRVPKLLIGPAGCGKTSCVSEVLAQLVLRAAVGFPSRPAPGLGLFHPVYGRILLVAPSDEAVDVVLGHFISRHGRVLDAAPEVMLTPGAALGQVLLRACKAISPAGKAWESAQARGFTPEEQAVEGRGAVIAVLSDQEGANVLRLCSPLRPPESFVGKRELYPYALLKADPVTGREAFVLPDVRLLARSLLVACTARVAALLPSLGLGKGSFSHIIFDEASQSVEPEALAALDLAGPDTRIVLSGDPRQLGPALKSSIAHDFGLAVSVQERLGLGRREGGGAGRSPLSPAAAVASVDSTPGLLVQDVSVHMANSLFVGRVDSVYTSYQADLLSGAWLGRRGLPRWPVEGGLPPTLNAASTTGGGRVVHTGPHGTASGALDSLDDGGAAVRGIFTRQPLAHMLETALTINYRSHQVLCDLPSRLFYQRAPIISHAPSARTTACLGFSLLAHNTAGMPYPMLAVGVDGEEEVVVVPSTQTSTALVHDEGSRSYVNVKECEAVAWIIQCLLAESGSASYTLQPEKRMLYRSSTGLTAEFPVPLGSAASAVRSHAPPMAVTQADIAVICPFRRQVLRMREVLRAAGLMEVNVGEPQNLQGADRPVVIVCTVLAKRFGASLLDYHRHKRRGAPLGLLLNDKSFNVAITRPESLLIAVGHAPTWCAEGRNWAELLHTAVQAGAFVGFGEATHCSVQVPPEAVARARGGTDGGGETTDGGGARVCVELFPPARGVHVRLQAEESAPLDAAHVQALLPEGMW